VVVTLGTRVSYRNLFGRFYMAAIDRVHRSFVTQTMICAAVEHAVGQTENGMSPIAAPA
jgi:hypothetical protein